MDAQRNLAKSPGDHSRSQRYPDLKIHWKFWKSGPEKNGGSGDVKTNYDSISNKREWTVREFQIVWAVHVVKIPVSVSSTISKTLRADYLNEFIV